MKKKNLIILLIIPFIISLLGIVTMNLTFQYIDADILFIEWDYNDTEAFKVNQRHKLEARGVNQRNSVVGKGNELMWTIKNKDLNDDVEHAKIIVDKDNTYLETLVSGEILLTCSNLKGNIFKTMNAIIYENGVIIANPKIRSSQNNIDSTIYYGEYDLFNQTKQKAKIEYEITTIPTYLKNALQIKNSTENVSLSLTNDTINILKEGDASITLGFDDNSIANDFTIQFKVVKDGINVYRYDELLYCTNQSKDGEIAVLRKSFESLENAYNDNFSLKSNNIESFGNFNKNNQKFSFDKEIYRFTTLYNHEYTVQWNKFAKNKKEYKEISDQVLAGLRIQKDFYGNGYTINFHNLAYPYNEQDIEGTIVAALTNDNLFRGPLPFYTLGDPNNLPLITAFGQDNIGMYVDGDNILINDVNVKNCDFGNNLSNLDYVGTVIDIYGNNNIIRNSRFSNGKNVMRSFSSMNLLIDNCMLSNSRNFLLETGSNEYEKIASNDVKRFALEDGSAIDAIVHDFLRKDNEDSNSGNSIVNNFVKGEFSNKTLMKNALISIQDALNDITKIQDQYKGSMEIKDTYFYQSGIASIALESLFNGVYLYSNSPSIIGEIFSGFSIEDRPIVPLEPTNVSGISYPVKVKISGNTTFYDYKNMNHYQLDGLISENISKIADLLGQNVRKITIDDIFPLKVKLNATASSKGYVYTNEENQKFINIPVAFYGGGANLSIVDMDDLNQKEHLGNLFDIDLLDNYLDLPNSSETMQMLKNLILKVVVTTIGSQPFQFICLNGQDGYLYGETPKVSDLIENAKGVQ